MTQIELIDDITSSVIDDETRSVNDDNEPIAITNREETSHLLTARESRARRFQIGG